MMKTTRRDRFAPHLRKINLSSLLLAALLLGGCAKESGNGGTTLPEGEYPMAFTATGISLNVEQTKATTDNNW